jgi:hypothetical protein
MSCCTKKRAKLPPPKMQAPTKELHERARKALLDAFGITTREAIIADIKRDQKAGRNSTRSVVTGQLIGYAAWVPARRAIKECFYCEGDMWTDQNMIDQVVQATGKQPIYACAQCAEEMMERWRAFTERKLAELRR